MSSSDLGVSLLQMTSTGDSRENATVITEALHNMKGLCLFVPENSLFFNTKAGPIVLSDALDSQSLVITDLQACCRKLKKCLHLGGIPWRKEGRVYNCALLIRENGELEETYCKTHLFDLELGSLKIKESASFTAGGELAIFKIQGWTFATAICYDLRFPVFARNRGDYDVYLLVANWPAARQHHWNTLLAARAIENQCYVVAVNRVGEDGNGVVYGGGSGIYNFQGEPDVVSFDTETVLSGRLDLAAQASYREAFPAWQDADEFRLEP